MTDDAIAQILIAWRKIPNDCIGILAYKREKNNILTKCTDNNIEKGTLRYLYEHGVSGDTVLIFKADILKKFMFPQFPGEKFVPEAYLYDLMDQEGRLFLLRKAIYVCEYLEDGYTSGMAKLLYNNPQGYFCYINQRLNLDTKIKQRFADSIRYDAMAIAHRKKSVIKNAVYPFWAAVAFPAGWLFFKKRYACYRKMKE